MNFITSVNKQGFIDFLKYTVHKQEYKKKQYCLRINFIEHGEDKRDGHVNIYFNKIWFDNVLKLLNQSTKNIVYIIRDPDKFAYDVLKIDEGVNFPISNLKIYLKPINYANSNFIVDI